MLNYEKVLVLLIVCGGAAISTVQADDTVRADDSVPVLLRYAQEYDARKATSDRVGLDALVSPKSPSHQAQQALQQRQLTARVKALTAQLAEKDRQWALLETRQQGALAAAAAREQSLATALTAKEKALAAQAARAPQPVALDTASARQAYATGVLFGRDVQAAREANRQRGLKLDEGLLMAGMVDALTGQTKMDERALAAAQAATREAAETALLSTVAARKKADAAWVARFMKEKGAVSAPGGYGYRVTYAGDGARLQADDTVELVVTESLTDGTVVSDMDRAGSRLTETVSALPPAFAGALVALKNHGSLTLVVPPSLAYGDKGYPPTVPPGATMVYRLRVADVVGVVPPPKKGKS